MLDLRPTCEHCNKSLPPDSTEARICSFECTFCETCVKSVLSNVCPNCAGGFVQRPVRPSQQWVGEAYLGKRPATTKVTHKPVDPQVHAALIARIAGLAPEQR